MRDELKSCSCWLGQLVQNKRNTKILFFVAGYGSSTRDKIRDRVCMYVHIYVQFRRSAPDSIFCVKEGA